MTETNQPVNKTLLPEEFELIKNQVEEAVANEYKYFEIEITDLESLLQALETALGKVERAKEAIRLLTVFINSNTPEDDCEVRSYCLSAKQYCQQTLKELED